MQKDVSPTDSVHDLWCSRLWYTRSSFDGERVCTPTQITHGLGIKGVREMRRTSSPDDGWFNRPNMRSGDRMSDVLQTPAQVILELDVFEVVVIESQE